MELSSQRWGSASPSNPINRLVFLHGMGGTGKLWRPIAASLETDFEILAPDQRGHGLSRPAQPPSFTPQDYGRDVIETLGSLAFHPAWVIGHSMGVRTAVAAAHLHPQWIRGLILIDLGFYGPAGGGLGTALRDFLSELPPSFPSRDDARRFMNTHCPDPSIAQYLLAVSVQEPSGGTVSFPFDADALIATVDAAQDFSLREWIRELAESHRIPFLVLRGETSRVWTRTEFEEEQRRFKDLPQIQFEEFPGAGHGLPFEKRREFVQRLRDFCAVPSRP